MVQNAKFSFGHTAWRTHAQKQILRGIQQLLVFVEKTMIWSQIFRLFAALCAGAAPHLQLLWQLQQSVQTACWILRTLHTGGLVGSLPLGFRALIMRTIFLFRPNHLLSLHCLSAAARGEEDDLGNANIGISCIANSCAANSKSVCSPGTVGHAMYEVDLDREQVINRSQRDEGAARELRIIHC